MTQDQIQIFDVGDKVFSILPGLRLEGKIKQVRKSSTGKYSYVVLTKHKIPHILLASELILIKKQ